MRKQRYWLLAAILLASAGSAHVCLAHSGDKLSAWATKSPTIDGVIVSGEWSDADTANFTLSYGDETHDVTLYVKNDATNLYLAVVIRNDDYETTPVPGADFANFYFDNDNDAIVEAGDDGLAVRYDGQVVADTHNPNGINGWAYSDADYGGTNDLQGAVTHTNPVPSGIGDYTFEYQHPLNSADDAHDFSLSTGDTVGFRFDFEGGYWPSSFPANYADIVIADICGSGRSLPASTWLMTAPACVPADPPGISINAQYGDDIPGGVYGTNWISYTWEGPTQSYVVMQGADPLAPGFGSWLYSTNAGVLRMTGTATTTTDCAAYGSSGQCFDIDLAIPSAGQNRWNFVGYPFPYAVNWADVKVAMSNNGGATWAVYSPSQAETAGYISKTYFRWSGNAYESYDDVTPGSIGVLRPQEAVWVRSLGSYSGPVPQKLKLLIPAQ